MVSRHQAWYFANSTCSFFFLLFTFLHHALQELDHLLHGCHFGSHGIGWRCYGSSQKNEARTDLHCALELSSVDGRV